MSDEMTDTVSAYEPGNGRARAATVFLGITLLLYVVAAASDVDVLVMLSQIQAGSEFNDAEIDAKFSRQESIGNLQNLLLFPTVIVFLMWIHRTYRNLPALGARRLRFTPGWAVGWWFVPIANFFRPFQIVREIWRASDPAVTDPEGWHAAPSSPLIGWWWAFFLASFVSFYVGGGDPVSDGLVNTRVFLATDSCGAVGACLAILLVNRVSARQTDKIRLVSSQPAPANSL